jgi:hypothetical protein
MKKDRQYCFFIQCYRNYEGTYKKTSKHIFQRFRKEIDPEANSYFIQRHFEPTSSRIATRTIGITFMVLAKTLTWAENAKNILERWGYFNSVHVYVYHDLETFKFLNESM